MRDRCREHVFITLTVPPVGVTDARITLGGACRDDRLTQFRCGSANAAVPYRQVRFCGPFPQQSFSALVRIRPVSFQILHHY